MITYTCICTRVLLTPHGHLKRHAGITLINQSRSQPPPRTVTHTATTHSVDIRSRTERLSADTGGASAHSDQAQGAKHVSAVSRRAMTKTRFAGSLRAIRAVSISLTVPL
jgi:hypothetical protein